MNSSSPQKNKQTSTIPPKKIKLKLVFVLFCWTKYISDHSFNRISTMQQNNGTESGNGLCAAGGFVEILHVIP